MPVAISFSRPDADGPDGDPDTSGSAEFRTVRRGLDPEQVAVRLDELGAEIEQLRETEESLRAQLRAAQRPIVDLREVDIATLSALVGEETADALSMARESATQSRQRAEDDAIQIVAAAYEEAGRVREAVQEETAYLRRVTAEQVEAELASARARGLEMVTEAREYREKVLADLAQRRDLAREQVRALIDGRDRLMRAFEVARLASVDMLAELEQALPADDSDPTPVTGVASVGAAEARPQSGVSVFDDWVAGDEEPEHAGRHPDHAENIDGAQADDVPAGEISVLVASDSPFGRREAALAPLVDALVRQWRRVMVDEQNAVLAAVRRSPNLSSIGELLPDEDAQLAQYLAASGEIDAAIDAGLVSMGATPDRERGEARLAAREVVLADLILPMRERLERVIETSGGNRFELSAYVRSSYREWKQSIEELATSTLVTSYSAGAYAALEPGVLIVWQPDPSGSPCAEVAANAGVVTRVPDQFPSGHVHPPATRSCRCLIQRLPE